MLNQELERRVVLARELAEQAGVGLRKDQENAFESLAIKTNRMDFATDADRASEQLIVEGIRSEFPDDGVLGEEGTNWEGSTGIRWVIDPLDGTANYVHGFPYFAVSIGVEVEGNYEGGVIYDPTRDQMYWAFNGDGAWCDGIRLQVTDPPLEKAFVAVCGAYSEAERADRAGVIAEVLRRAGDLRVNACATLD